MNNQTAILIFTRTAQEEAQQKWSAQLGSAANGRHIAQTLIAHTRKVAKATGYPVIEVSTQHQQGQSFGARLSHAIQNIWNRGFENVLIVGTDTPSISTKLLQQAANQITPTQSVIGAATDGGAYLIGLHYRQFNADSFATLPWQQEELYRALSAHLSQDDQALHLLPILSDIDHWEALVHFIQTTPLSLLQVRLRYYLLSSEQATTLLPLPKAWNKNFTAPTYNRPPPISTVIRA
ncbi:MAG: TIGR04282 family arsenosugar biosynthesis glycosyltransferase [Aureispira sp.]